MKKIATIILNRNLPKITDHLYERIKSNSSKYTDIYVLEAGSDKNNLSKNCTWYANETQVMKNGLRVPRGFNYALNKLLLENKFYNYEYFFLLTNDTVFGQKKILKPLLDLMEDHPKVGILSPCPINWGEYKFLKETKIKYFWYLQNTAYLIRRSFIENISPLTKSNFKNILYDSSNFRGYGTEFEIIAKGYINGWATALTNQVTCKENETYLKEFYKDIKTDSYNKNLELYLKEGKEWMLKKYGFKSKWDFISYIKHFYDIFFEHNQNLKKFKIN